MTDVDLVGAAAMMRRSYSWFQKHWRDLRHPATGEAFPQPYVGAEKGGRPWWKATLIEAWQLGSACPAGEGAEGSTQRAPANDAAPQPKSTDVSALVAAAGG